MIKAVIFDRDGVLLDSEYTNVLAGELAFRALGVQLTEDEKKSIVGRHVDDYSAPLLKKYGVGYDDFRRLQRDNYYQILESTPVFEKTIQLVKDIHAKGITLALCTSGGKDSTIRILERLGIKNLFRRIVTTEDYTKRKPDPEPYKVTAEKLDLKPEECLVIEDSQVGLQAALAAGMKCVVIFNEHTKEHDFTGALQVVDSADKVDLPDILREHSKKSILITAVAGSGKSTICKALVDLGYEAYDIENIPGLFSVVDPHTDKPLEGKSLGDLKEGLDADWVCDPGKLNALMANQKKDVAFYCGGTSRTEELMAQFDATIVLQVSDETTRKRLSGRLQGAFGNNENTRAWVLSWKHKVEADWLAAGGIGVSAEADPKSVAKNIAERWMSHSKNKGHKT